MMMVELRLEGVGRCEAVSEDDGGRKERSKRVLAVALSHMRESARSIRKAFTPKHPLAVS